MLTRRWTTLERQRPRLKIVKWGELAGLLLFAGGFVGFPTMFLGILFLVGFGVYGYRILAKPHR